MSFLFLCCGDWLSEFVFNFFCYCCWGGIENGEFDEWVWEVWVRDEGIWIWDDDDVIVVIIIVIFIFVCGVGMSCLFIFFVVFIICKF